MSSSSLTGICGFKVDTGGGMRLRMDSKITPLLLPEKAILPVAIS
jgi:hypothetical protein